ncbi:MAG: extracellular solute-binding protein [Treponema sp.]|jgi:multiple sugar transport system substrate-binding protein|nr:extracellular solute-binding protein [Treponema sp.]
MKRKVFLAVAFLLIVSVLPCFAGARTESKGSGQSQKLVIAARGGLHVDAINSAKARFETENNCTIEILGLEADDLKQKISLDSVNSAGAYDLAMADDPWMPEFTAAGIYQNLTKMGLADDSDFIPASLAIGKDPYKTGDTYALPFAGNVQLLFYNKALFDTNGISIPTDWAGVLAASQKLKAAGKLGYIIRGQQGNPIVSDYLPLLWAFGGNVFDGAGQVTVDSQAGKDALQLYIELLKTGANYERNDLVAAVADGNAGMALGWPSWFISGTNASAAWAVIPGKAAAGSAAYPTGMIGHWMMGVTANSTHKELALKFLTFITSSEIQKLMADNGGVPTRRSVYSDPSLVQKYAYYPTLLQATVDSVVRPRLVEWSEIESVYGIELSTAVSGSKSVNQALADAKTAIEAILKKK